MRKKVLDFLSNCFVGFSDPCIFNSNLKTCLHAIFDHRTSRVLFEVSSQQINQDSKIKAPDVYFAKPVRTWVLHAQYTTTLDFCPTLQMFCMQFLQMNVCQPNPQTTLSNFNSLKPVIKKRQLNAVFTVFQKGFLHVFVCNF